ncbi:MAG: ScyD/ScyE family protein [Devosia sp.]
MRASRSISTVALSLLLPALASPALAQALTVPNLANPRGLAVDGDALLVTEQKGGRILSVAADGTVTVIAEGLVAGEYTSPEGPTITGVNAVVKSGDSYIFTIGGSLGTIAGSEAVYTLKPGEAPVLLADLGAYEKANNTGDDVNQEGQPDIDSNPYDLVADGEGGAYVVDAAANAIFHVDSAGTIAVHAQFPDLPNPLAGTVGGPTIDQVPTGLTRGPDGALYVTTLTGFPFPAGAARVYRVADDGTVSTYAEGLSAATDLAFEADGALLVTEFSTDFLNQAPGRLVRVKDGAITEVAAGLISPTGVAVLTDGTIVVTQEFAGVVAAVAE